MSDNERMTTSSTGAMKAENDERYDLIPTEPLRLLAKHYGIGSKKYDERNWEKGIEWHKNFASANRHMQQFWAGEDIDEETGTPHVISAAWHMFALAEYMITHRELDDRPHTQSNVQEPESVGAELAMGIAGVWTPVGESDMRYRWDASRGWEYMTDSKPYWRPSICQGRAVFNAKGWNRVAGS